MERVRPIVIVCFGFARSRLRRQPWAAAHGMAEGFHARGRSVTILTDAGDAPKSDDYEVVRVDDLFAFGAPSEALRSEIEARDPDAVFCFTGAWQLARSRAFTWRAKTWLVMASPRLTIGEIVSPGWRLALEERSVLTLPLVNALLPGWLLMAGYRRCGADGMVYLSAATQARFAALGLPRGTRVRPQVKSFTGNPDRPPGDPPVVAYLGPPLEMRGAYLALETFELAIKRGAKARLLLLLRPDGDPTLMERFLDRVKASPVRGLVQFETEMLSLARLNELTAVADVFLLPFRAPVSEVPLVVLETGLSGRPVVVLAAPGVSEYAEELGGIVAESPAALPDALMHVLQSDRTPRIDPSRWSGWPQAVGRLLSYSRRPLEDYRMIALCGVDGSGKSHLLRYLEMELSARNMSSRHVWTRFRNYLSKPLLALARLTGHNRKSTAAGAPIGYHEFRDAPWLARTFLALQVVDNVIDMRWRYRGAKSDLIVADRCIVDTLVDWAIDTGMDDWIIDRLGPKLMRLLPTPRLVVIVERPADLVAKERPDAFADKNFARRRALYQRIAATYRLPIIRNDGLAEDAIDEIVALVLGNGSIDGGQAHDLRLLQQ